MAVVIVGNVAVSPERLAGDFAMIPQSAVLTLPTEYLDNLQSWIATEHGIPTMMRQGLVQIGWPLSAFVLAAWIAGLIGLACNQSNRQDVT